MSIQHVKPKNQYALIQDDILHWSATYKGPKFHSLLCDPPYHLTSIVKRFSKGEPGHTKTARDIANRSTPHARQAAGFMHQVWDGEGPDGKGIAFNPETWAALTEHLYPGGFVMAFAGTRGYHRMACAMEDSGLIIHPAAGWVTLSGFPKATRIDTQIDKAAGAEREIIGPSKWGSGIRSPNSGLDGWQREAHAIEKPETAPATPLAQTWAGHRYGLQALKPAFEFIAIAQVPYSGRPIDNITQTGAGALNIDGGRIPASDKVKFPAGVVSKTESIYGAGVGLYADNPRPDDNYPDGRWPANLILSHNPGCNGECEPDCPVKMLDEQSGNLKSGTLTNRTTKGIWTQDKQDWPCDFPGDSGGASRMFFQSDWQYEILEQLENAAPLRYEPKVSTAERNAGLEDPNHHPTLKPISLTKYLATLLLPPEAYAPRRLLVPFAGSGSEMIGAILAGWDEVIGIEQSADYVSIAEARLRWWSQWPGWGQTDVDKILAAIEPNKSQAVQMELF